MRPDEVEHHIKKLDEGFGGVVIWVPERGYGEPLACWSAGGYLVRP